MSGRSVCDGDIYWCLLPSMESENYPQDFPKPVKPWRGKIVTEQRPGGLFTGIYRYDPDTGIIRTDSNSYAAVQLFTKLYDDEKSAKAAYVEREKLAIESLEAEVRHRRAALALYTHELKHPEGVEGGTVFVTIIKRGSATTDVEMKWYYDALEAEENYQRYVAEVVVRSKGWTAYFTPRFTENAGKNVSIIDAELRAIIDELCENATMRWTRPAWKTPEGTTSQGN